MRIAKRVVLFMTISVLATNINGQINICHYSEIERTPTGNNTAEDGFVESGNCYWFQEANLISGKFLYMLAYEPNYPQGCFDNTIRNVYLYCKDTTNKFSRWIRVSDVVFENYYFNQNNYQDIDFFKYNPKLHNTSSSKIVADGNNLVITMNIHAMKDGSMTISSQTVVLKIKRRDFDGNFYSTEHLSTVASNNIDESKSAYSDKVLSNNGSKVQTSTNVSNNSIAEDNLSLEEVSKLRDDFINGINQKPYNRFENHTFNLDFNAPYADNERGYEPQNVKNGYQRKYFINSNIVCMQRKVVNNVVTEMIYFHPNGKIYNVVSILNEKPSGRVKYVDLDNYVILEGELKDGKLVGYWNTPVVANFNTQDVNLINQYPGVVNQIGTLINFYNYNRDNRVFNMN